jgi:hypothetical protein
MWQEAAKFRRQSAIVLRMSFGNSKLKYLQELIVENDPASRSLLEIDNRIKPLAGTTAVPPVRGCPPVFYSAKPAASHTLTSFSLRN